MDMSLQIHDANDVKVSKICFRGCDMHLKKMETELVRHFGSGCRKLHPFMPGVP